MQQFFFIITFPFLASLIHAFPDRAGGTCPGGRPAVGGIHVSYGTDGSRHVQSGNLRDSHLQLYVDGTDLSTTGTSSAPLVVRTGLQHSIEIVSSVTARPFKGALLRVAPTQQDDDETANIFELSPMIHAGHAEICTEPAQGVAHTDAEPKAVLSAGWTALTAGTYTIDVTVVEANNDTSVYWYSHFVVEAKGTGSTTREPMVGAEECHVCGDTEIVLRDRSVQWQGASVTCQQLATMGRAGQFSTTTSLCSQAKALAAQHCLCSAALADDTGTTTTTTTPSSNDLLFDNTLFFDDDTTPCYVCGSKDAVSTLPDAVILFANEIGTCGELVADGHMGAITDCPEAQQLAQASCGCSNSAADRNNVPTYTPTITPLPTSATPCYVCGDTNNNDGMDVTSEGHVMLGDVIVSCQDLSLDGLQGYIPPELCAEAQAVAAEFCHCTTIAGATNNNVPSSTTFTPTATPYPTFAETCPICPPGHVVTKPDQTVTVDGGVGTCRELEQEGATGFVAPSICPDAQVTARLVCGCSSNTATVPTPTVTTTTTTLYPTYQSTCYVCGNEHAVVTNMDAEVVVGGDRGTCKELQQVALSQLLPETMCAEAQAEAKAQCQCGVGAKIPDTTTTPTTQPTVTMFPTFAAQCHVCPEGMQVTALDVSVAMDGITGLTCAELEEAGKEHIIPPMYCATAQSIARKSCQCETINIPSPSSTLRTFSPTKTPLPTITATPTFTDVCQICPANTFVTASHALVTVDNMLVTCAELEEAAREHMIPPSLCPTLQDKAAVACGCRKPAHTTTATLPTKSPIWTFQPTITAEPTLTVSPTFAARCEVCGVDQTISKPHQIVKVAGIVLTCRDLEGAGVKSLIPPYHCGESRQIAHEECGCTPLVFSPPAPSSKIHTFRPTITSEPTRTAEPTHAEVCELCTNGGKVSILDALVTIEGYLLTCEALEEFATHKLLSVELCMEAQQQAQDSCACSTAVPDVLEIIEAGGQSDTPNQSDRNHWILLTAASLALLIPF